MGVGRCRTSHKVTMAPGQAKTATNKLREMKTCIKWQETGWLSGRVAVLQAETSQIQSLGSLGRT